MSKQISDIERIMAIQKILPLMRMVDASPSRAMAASINQRLQLARALWPAAFRSDIVLRSAFPTYFSALRPGG